MKKAIIFASMLIGGFALHTTYAVAAPVAQVCDPSKPCVYTGKAKADNNDTIDIKVYEQNGAWVANFTKNGKEYTMYVVIGTDGRCHVNYNGKAYYFTI